MSGSAGIQDDVATLHWTPSVFFVESLVRCPLDFAWQVMLKYEEWNPTFVGAHVRPVKGEWRKAGELVSIKKTGSDGASLPEFYAETVAVVERRRIVWYVHPLEGHVFRNFVDFSLSEVVSGVLFSINYYAQAARYGELTEEQRRAFLDVREETIQSLQRSADAFKHHCETSISPS